MKKITILLAAIILAMPSISMAQTDTLKIKDSLNKILSDKNSELYLRLAQISLDAGKYGAVIAYADSALAKNKSFMAYRLKGIAQFNLGMYIETTKSMSAGIQKNDNDFIMHYLRGLSYHKMDSLNYAKEISQDMTYAIRLNPADTMPYFYKGIAEYNLSLIVTNDSIKNEKLKESVYNLNRFIKVKPTFDAYYICGMANGQIAENSQTMAKDRIVYYNEVISNMTECLKSKPNDPDILNYRFISYALTKDFVNADKDCKKLIKLGEKPKKSPIGFFK
jgi:tetratricopeptide (TPR) repeat protein